MELSARTRPKNVQRRGERVRRRRKAKLDGYSGSVKGPRSRKRWRKMER